MRHPKRSEMSETGDPSFGRILQRHARINGDVVALSYGPDALS